MNTDRRRTGDVVVIGIGNPFRRDDGVGPAVAERLRAQRLPGVRLAVSTGEATALIELWAGARLAVVVDALRTEPPTPGRIHRLSVVEPPDPEPEPGIVAETAASPRTAASPEPTETVDPDLDFGEAVELARILGRLPDRLVLFAVEASDVGYGPGLTPAVAAAAGRIAAEIVNQVATAAA
jgi:hydrogenase maturation protease